MHKTLARRLAIAVILALGIPSLVPVSFANCPLTVLPGNGSTSGNARAPSTRYRFARSTYLITAAEMAASGIQPGVMTGIGWTTSTASGVAGAAPLKVYLELTDDSVNTKSTTWATAISTMTEVHNATTSLPATVGQYDVPFSGGTPFSYVAGKGLYVGFDWGQHTGTLSTTTVIACSNTLTNGLNGAQSTTAAPTTTAASSFRPETRLLGPALPTDVSVDFVIANGAIPLGYVGAQTIQATVFQNGDTDLTNVPVTLNITGTETMTDTQNVSSLLKCGTGGSLVTFTTFSPTLLGSNTLTVSVPADAAPANDTLARQLDVTVNKLSFEHAGTPADGGAGFSAAGAEFVSRFNVISTQLDSATLNFFSATATTYRLVVRADDGTGKPGALLYLDSADRTVLSPGQVTIALPTPIPVNGNFFVGFRQTNVTNASISFNYEFPIRASTFFYNTTPDTAAWTDLSTAGPYFQLNIGVTIGNCLIPLSVDVTPDNANACVGDSVFMATTSTGTEPYTYQWTEDGVDVLGATSDSYTPSKASAGTYAYNARVADAGGCAAVSDPTPTTITWGPGATVSGSATICAGGSTTIQAALTGTGPWNLTWSDGFVQNGVTTSPATRVVSPASTTTYTVTLVGSGTCPSGSSTGSAVVTVDNVVPSETAAGQDFANQLQWTTKQDLVWPANPSATSYALYRGVTADLPNLLTAALDSCTRYQGTAATATGLTETPAAGDADWYLVTGRTVCFEGSAGASRVVNSSGVCP